MLNHANDRILGDLQRLARYGLSAGTYFVIAVDSTIQLASSPRKQRGTAVALPATEPVSRFPGPP